METSDFRFISDLIRELSAIVLEENKIYLVEARLSAVCREEGLADLPTLVQKLRLPGALDLQTRVVEAMTTNETSFFRDIHPFELLKKEVLPDLIKRRETERKLNIWCAACSTGQEPYSIAMLLREHFPELADWKVRILATDLSTEVLDRAASGTYSQLEVNRGLPAAMLVKYFEKDGTSWRVKSELQDLMDFKPLNLIERWPPIPPIDVIFIRNVLIYFDREAKTGILGNIRRNLAPDGYMFLGAAETTMNLDDSFERLKSGKTSCYRVKAD